MSNAITLTTTRITIAGALCGAPNGNGGTVPDPAAIKLPKVGDMVTVEPPRAERYTGEVRAVSPCWLTVRISPAKYRKARVSTVVRNAECQSLGKCTYPRCGCIGGPCG